MAAKSRAKMTVRAVSSIAPILRFSGFGGSGFLGVIGCSFSRDKRVGFGVQYHKDGVMSNYYSEL